MQNDIGDIERADLHVAAHGASYYSCSGDSYWVRQYMEWSDEKGAGSNQGGRPLALVVKGALDAEVTLQVAVGGTRRGAE